MRRFALIPGVTTRYRDGLGISNEYLRWGIVEEVYEDDVEAPGVAASGRSRNTLAYARSVKVRWLHHPAGRSSVRFLEPWGVTSMPMIGSVVAVGFTGGPKSEPIVLGFWTQGYQQRIPGELGNLLPGQEIWRRSGLRFRVLPYYDDLREFADQINKSPWTLDVIMGEQHDEACFCAICQVRYPARRSTVNGVVTFSCPTSCPDCNSPLTLVKGSIAPGEGDAWLAVQSELLINTVLNGLFTYVDENILGKQITDVRLQQNVRNFFRRYISSTVRATWGENVEEYFRGELVNRWEGILREYFTVGSLLNYANDASGLIDSTLITTLVVLIDGWVQTQLFYYLTDRISNEERAALIRSFRENARTYVTDFIPSVIESYSRAFIDNKARTYLTEVVARLRRKATNWLYKDVLAKYKNKALDAIKARLKLDFGGLRSVRDEVAQYAADALAKIAELDFVNAMNQALTEGLQDPEPLPIFEIRGDQDLNAVANAQTGREEGQGQKASRFRFKLYRDGEMRLQIQDTTSIIFSPDGTVELDCAGPLNISANRLNSSFEEESNIRVKSVMNIGGSGDTKEVVLNDDDVKEYDPGGVLGGAISSVIAAAGGLYMGELSGTRGFIQYVAWLYILERLIAIGAVAVIPALVTEYGNMLTQLTKFLPGVIIGKTESSAEHLKGN